LYPPVKFKRLKKGENLLTVFVSSLFVGTKNLKLTKT
jgi:hypothetical protein